MKYYCSLNKLVIIFNCIEVCLCVTYFFNISDYFKISVNFNIEGHTVEFRLTNKPTKRLTARFTVAAMNF